MRPGSRAAPFGQSGRSCERYAQRPYCLGSSSLTRASHAGPVRRCGLGITAPSRPRIHPIPYSGLRPACATPAIVRSNACTIGPRGGGEEGVRDAQQSFRHAPILRRLASFAATLGYRFSGDRDRRTPRGAADRSGVSVHSRAAHASPAPEEPQDLEPPIHSAGAATASTSTKSSGSGLHYPGLVSRERTESEPDGQVRAWGVA